MTCAVEDTTYIESATTKGNIMLFQQLDVGEVFHTGKAKGSGINSDVVMMTTWKKLSKSTAICVDKMGYGNKRGVNSIDNFSANVGVYKVKQ